MDNFLKFAFVRRLLVNDETNALLLSLICLFYVISLNGFFNYVITVNIHLTSGYSYFYNV